MKHIVLLSMFVCIELISTGQTITGKVVSMQTGRPLMYASIGIVNTRFGTNANEKVSLLCRSKILVLI
jgi:hypothetical protein